MTQATAYTGTNKDITFDQTEYTESLQPVELAITRDEGRTQDTHMTPDEVWSFRSLACGIAWTGVTNVWSKDLPRCAA